MSLTYYCVTVKTVTVSYCIKGIKDKRRPRNGPSQWRVLSARGAHIGLPDWSWGSQGKLPLESNV